MFKYRMPKNIFGLKRQCVTEDKKGMRNVVLHVLWGPTNSVGVIIRIGGACDN